MKRKIVKIDEEKCTGCGQCASVPALVQQKISGGDAERPARQTGGGAR